MSFAESLFDLIEKVVNFLFVISPFPPASAESRVLNPADHGFVIRCRAFIPWSHMPIIVGSRPGRNRTPGCTSRNRSGCGPQIRVPRSGSFFVHGMGEDLAGRLGPGERLATVVPAVGEQADRGCELADGAERAAADGVASEAGIRAWIEHGNAHPRPFAWTMTVRQAERPLSGSSVKT